MKSSNLDAMFKGWFIGDFDPTILKSDKFEVGVKYYDAGEKEERHVHKVATEITVVVEGSVRMCDRIWQKGDIIVIEPGESTAFEALSDAVTTVVKVPSVKDDKYTLGEDQTG